MLEGKVAIVSGIGPGMGRDIALLLADTAPTSCSAPAAPRRARRSPRRCARSVGRPRSCALDITDAAACEEAVARAVGALGGLDILVNNAFHDGNRKAFLDAPLEEWRQTMDVNFWGTLQMTRAAVPAMIERGGGRVVMVNTMSAHRIEPTYGAYAASKGALETATKTLAARARRPRHPGERHPPRLHLGRLGGVVLRLPRQEARHQRRGGVPGGRRRDRPRVPAALERDRRVGACSSRRTCRSRSPGRAST